MTSSSDTLNTAIQHHQAGQLLEAEQLYQDLLLQQPNQANVLYLLGLAAHQAGRLDAAADWYRRSLAVKPDYEDAHNNLGVVMLQRGDLQQAVIHYQAALQANPNNPRIHANLGVILQQTGQLAAAIAQYQTAIQLEPELVSAQTNLGHALKQIGQLDAAIAHYETARQLMPTNPDAYKDLGDALQEQGKFAAALEIYDRAISLAPDHIELGGSRVRALLISGDLQNGFAAYDHWRLTVASRPRSFAQPAWNGAPLNGQTVLLYAEAGSGYGDSIHLIRYAALVRQRGGRVIVECQSALVRLFQALPTVEQVVAAGDPLPLFSVQTSLLSLPHILGTTLDTIPATVPYLFVPALDLKLDLKAVREPESHGQLISAASSASYRKVGIVWGGNPEHSHDRDRSCPLSEFTPFLQTPGVAFYSLQTGIHRSQLSPNIAAITDVSHRLTDFADTAALVAQLDLVITVDTAIAHLAGALGKPVWILLAFAPDWRWLMYRSDSPWYPTARLFRQPQRNDWTSVCRQVANELSEWVRSTTAS